LVNKEVLDPVTLTAVRAGSGSEQGVSAKS